ncbi:peptidase m20 [Trichococcus palustris]|jgi:amidohydrolase|uniref:Peptidase m20 n=1 Tax=Trichococcus palustris TaxID=140314 RepID=A0A143YLB8_9LACT|nr:amidohydrolase [Trichococcus palustris]CZQ91703.1 peptidase m20 [Trichococcus palustris]SFL04087.1 amidohydrolase [Trichococcus palustris]
MLRDKLMNMLNEREEEMISLRRHFHEYPEISFQEKETSAFIARFYEGKEVEVHTHVGNGYGIVVTIKGKNPGKTIALRADFDALKIEEQTGLPFASKNPGVMHACGHDGHTAYLLVLADCLIRLKDEWDGTVKIVHQHAEEQAPAGAKSIVDSGLLDDVDEIYGIHFYPDYETGTIFYTSGYAYAGCSDINVHIQGTGGHGSAPHKANDVIVAASSFVMNLQTIASRRINPYDMAVVTIGSFEGVGSSNVIKDNLILRGDARYMDLEVGKVIEEHFHRIGRGLAEMYDVKVDIEYNSDYPPLYNHPEQTAKAIAVLEKEGIGDYLDTVVAVPANTGAEDFGQYLLKIPGAFLNVGARPEQAEVFDNHHPKFDINEKSLLVAAKAVGDITLAALLAK